MNKKYDSNALLWPFKGSTDNSQNENNPQFLPFNTKKMQILIHRNPTGDIIKYHSNHDKHKA